MTSDRSIAGLLLLLCYGATSITLICVGAERIPRQVGRTVRMGESVEPTEEEAQAYRQIMMASEGFKLAMAGVAMFGAAMLAFVVAQCREEFRLVRAARVEPTSVPPQPVPV